jgi:hypothetical protein
MLPTDEIIGSGITITRLDGTSLESGALSSNSRLSLGFAKILSVSSSGALVTDSDLGDLHISDGHIFGIRNAYFVSAVDSIFTTSTANDSLTYLAQTYTPVANNIIVPRAGYVTLASGNDGISYLLSVQVETKNGNTFVDQFLVEVNGYPNEIIVPDPATVLVSIVIEGS